MEEKFNVSYNEMNELEISSNFFEVLYKERQFG